MLKEDLLEQKFWYISVHSDSEINDSVLYETSYIVLCDQIAYSD